MTNPPVEPPETEQVGGAGAQLAGEEDDGGDSEISSDSVGEGGDGRGGRSSLASPEGGGGGGGTRGLGRRRTPGVGVRCIFFSTWKAGGPLCE
jgi:hypothetical protein